MSVLLCEREGNEIRLALMENGVLTDYSRADVSGVRAEQIYLAKVDRLMPGTRAAFVRLDKTEIGYLSFDEAPPRAEKNLRSGESVLVQVKKPPIHDKRAYLTREISFAGRYVILLPLTDIVRVSRRLGDEERGKLKRIGEAVKPAGMGLVMRSESGDAGESALREEIAALTEKWERLQAQDGASPRLLADAEHPASRFLRDLKNTRADEIIANCEDALPPDELPGARIESDPFSRFNARTQLEKALHRQQWLPCGGTLIVDVCEAMTVIDVNTGKFAGLKSGAEEAKLKVNLEAVDAVAALLRVRNFGGMILVDLIDMESQEHGDFVLARAREKLRLDRVKAVAHDITPLGILEITRKRAEDAQERGEETL